METKKYSVKVERLVRIWMTEEYEVDAVDPDEAEKQVDFGLVDPIAYKVMWGTERDVPMRENDGNPTRIYKIEEADDETF